MKFVESDIITTDGYLEIVENYSDKICHIKTDYFNIGNFNWRGKNHPEKILKKVIISHSDLPVRDDMVNNFELVFCVNNETTKSNVFSLPLGIPNCNSELKILEIIGNKKKLIEVIEKQNEQKFLLYMNFTVQTNVGVRKKLFENFKHFDWVVKTTPSMTEGGMEDYLDAISKSKFVLCPTGNGYDTHRLWETLYLGSIPIIQKHRTHDICDDLPVLFTNDWSEINQEYLNNKFEEIKNKKYNLEKLKLSYWDKFISEKINENV